MIWVGGSKEQRVYSVLATTQFGMLHVLISKMFLAFCVAVKLGVLRQEEKRHLRVCKSRVVRGIFVCDRGRNRGMWKVL